jgi:hypothetical protein
LSQPLPEPGQRKVEEHMVVGQIHFDHTPDQVSTPEGLIGNGQFERNGSTSL